MNKEYFLIVNGNKIKVSEEIYKVYWKEKNHENYLKQIDRKKSSAFKMENHTEKWYN